MLSPLERRRRLGGPNIWSGLSWRCRLYGLQFWSRPEPPKGGHERHHGQHQGAGTYAYDEAPAARRPGRRYPHTGSFGFTWDWTDDPDGLPARGGRSNSRLGLTELLGDHCFARRCGGFRWRRLGRPCPLTVS
ncbi:MAG: hypothetical protein ACREKS_05245, partial [Candidatus Rokuibacteriota bacterium]